MSIVMYIKLQTRTDLIIGSVINTISNMIIQLNITEPGADLSFTRRPNKMYYVYYDTGMRDCDH